MSAVLPKHPLAVREASPGLWALAWKRLLADRVGMIPLAVGGAFLSMKLASYAGPIAKAQRRILFRQG